ncbi:acetyl esterase/lipase [Pseudacidovorax intermedius]|uniref:Acetyl esterase/lipase n=1 Tax=Pseudacidovorax intermedius TaxID=433924 RepID=A0A370FEA6_9BURK|nr:alpha/beta hydrolase [Pseudacidovorax intermedius]RDI23314.1 acetyl esterase/lipase [Pseudacidovorax intermedius]
MTPIRHWLPAIALLLTAALAHAAPDRQQAYGPDPAQRLDVYLPAQPHGAPILVMVHGGAWMFGRPDAPNVVDAKVAHWVRERGFVFVSVGYRLVPQVDVRAQAQDVARALAEVQRLAPDWHADADRLVLMGHSAGAHLVALLSADPSLATAQGARRWRGTVVLDSAALDTEGLMQHRHLRFYDRAFGADPALWRAVSPTARLAPGSLPMLLVCASERRDDSCGQSARFADRVRAAGGQATVLPQPLSHGEINAQLGTPSGYTQAVDRFIDGWAAPVR